MRVLSRRGACIEPPIAALGRFGGFAQSNSATTGLSPLIADRVALYYVALRKWDSSGNRHAAFGSTAVYVAVTASGY